jgi:hypothetical protein
MTKLDEALKDFTTREQFHDCVRLDAIIQAVREEEQSKFAKLVELAKSIAKVSMKEPKHCGHGPCSSDTRSCICGCSECRP